MVLQTHLILDITSMKFIGSTPWVVSIVETSIGLGVWGLGFKLSKLPPLRSCRRSSGDGPPAMSHVPLFFLDLVAQEPYYVYSKGTLLGVGDFIVQEPCGKKEQRKSS